MKSAKLEETPLIVESRSKDIKSDTQSKSECLSCAQAGKMDRRSFGMSTSPIPEKITMDNWTSVPPVVQRENCSNTEMIPKIATTNVGVATVKPETRDAIGGTCHEEKIFRGVLRHQIVNTTVADSNGACVLCHRNQPDVLHRDTMTEAIEPKSPAVAPKPTKITVDVATDPHLFEAEKPVVMKRTMFDRITSTDDVTLVSSAINTDFVVISTPTELKTTASNTEKMTSRTVFTATDKTEFVHKQSGTDLRYRDAQVSTKWSGITTATNTVVLEMASRGSGEDTVDKISCEKCEETTLAAQLQQPKEEVLKISVGVGSEAFLPEVCHNCEILAKVIKNDIGTDSRQESPKFDAHSNTEIQEINRMTVAVGDCSVEDVICNICSTSEGFQHLSDEQNGEGKPRSRSFDTAEFDNVRKSQPPMALVCPKCKCPVTKEDMFASRESLSSLASSRAHSMEQIISPLEGSDYQPSTEMTNSCEGRLEKFDFAKPRGTRATALSQAAATKKLLTSDDSSKKTGGKSETNFKRGTFMSRSVRVEGQKGDSLAYITDKNSKDSSHLTCRTGVKSNQTPVETSTSSKRSDQPTTPDFGLKRKVEIKGRPQVNGGSRIAIPTRIPPVPPRTSPTAVRRNIVRSISATNGPTVSGTVEASSKEEVAEALDSLAPLPSDLSRSWSATASLHSSSIEANGYVNPVSEQESIATADHKLVGDVVENLPDQSDSR